VSVTRAEHSPLAAQGPLEQRDGLGAPLELSLDQSAQEHRPQRRRVPAREPVGQRPLQGGQLGSAVAPLAWDTSA
jgi:hypothetical protein